jgi:16S rRNA (uracil1498-N3)-methyltransferase
MRLTRVFTPGPLANNQTVELTPVAANHVAKVLRARVGEIINVFDGAGHEFRASIQTIKGKSVVVVLGTAVTGTSESPLNIVLTQGISRGERMDWVVQKATELGVAAIVPVITARSVVKLDKQQAAKKYEHWRNIVIGACEQCGRNLLPQLAQPLSLPQHLSSRSDSTLRLVLDPTAPQSLSHLQPVRTIELLIGPEGGLDDDELAGAKHAGFIAVKLGPRVLRTETAAIVALAVLQEKWGDLK